MISFRNHIYDSKSGRYYANKDQVKSRIEQEQILGMFQLTQSQQIEHNHCSIQDYLSNRKRKLIQQHLPDEVFSIMEILGYLQLNITVPELTSPIFSAFTPDRFVEISININSSWICLTNHFRSLDCPSRIADSQPKEMRIRLSRQLSSYRFLTFHSKVYVILLLEESLQLSQLSVMKIEGDEIYKLCTYSVERSVNAKDVIVTRKHQIVLLEKGHVVHGSIGNDLVPLKIETKSQSIKQIFPCGENNVGMVTKNNYIYLLSQGCKHVLATFRTALCLTAVIYVSHDVNRYCLILQVEGKYYLATFKKAHKTTEDKRKLHQLSRLSCLDGATEVDAQIIGQMAVVRADQQGWMIDLRARKQVSHRWEVTRTIGSALISYLKAKVCDSPFDKTFSIH